MTSGNLLKELPRPHNDDRLLLHRIDIRGLGAEGQNVRRAVVEGEDLREVDFGAIDGTGVVNLDRRLCIELQVGRADLLRVRDVLLDLRE